MLEATNTALSEALASPSRRLRPRILADWAGDGLYQHTYSDLSQALSSSSLSREARGSLPTEVSLVEGHNVGSLKFRLSGEVAGTPASYLFSTWQPNSPLVDHDLVGTRVKCDVIVSTAIGEVTLPRFRGVIRSVDVESKARRVDIEVLDLAATLYAPITLPTYGFQHNNVLLYKTNPGINAQWVVDHILRANGIYTSPPPAPNAKLAIPGHGGYGPSIGQALGNHNGMLDVDDRVEANWPGLLAPPGPYRVPTADGLSYVDFETQQAYAATDKLDLSAVGKGVACGMWVRYGSGISTSTTDRNILILYPFEPLTGSAKLAAWIRLNGDVLASMYNNSNTAVPSTLRSLGAGDQWRYIGIHWYRSGTDSWTISIRSDGGTTVGTAQTLSLPEAPRLRMLADVMWWYPLTNFHVWQEDNPTPTWHGEEAFTPQAHVPRSLNELLYVPETRRANSLSLLRDVAGAEFARFGFDEAGVFKYRPASSEEAYIGSQDLEVTSEMSLLDLSSTRRLDSIRNEVSIEVEERFTDPLRVTDRWSINATAKEQFRSAPGTTVFPVVFQRDSLAPVAVQVPFVADANWTDTSPLDGFHVVRVDDPTIVPSGVTVQLWKTGHYSGELWVFNTSGTTVQFQRLGTDGTPAMRVHGLHVDPTGTFVATAVDSASRTKFGARVYALGREVWRSKTNPFNGVADVLLTFTKVPTTVLENVPILGDPRIQIGDQHHVKDPRGLGGVSALVEGFREVWDRRRGLRTEVMYRVLREAPPTFVLDSESAGILDKNILG